jgi:signal transduction histidine kinase
MFRSLRWRLTVWFVVLGAAVYVVLALLGMVLFHHGLTGALDVTLDELSAETLPALDYDDGRLMLRSWTTDLSVRPSRLLVTIQLYDPQGHLLQASGPEGMPKLFRGTVETGNGRYQVRSTSRTVLHERQLVGYLQLQLPVVARDRAVQEFAATMALIAPLLLLGLGVAGYVYSRQSARPIEEAFLLLRQFMADAGHEIRTPISIIRSAAENLAEETQDTTAASRIEVIIRSTTRMEKLVKDLLLLAKLEGRHQAQQRVPVQMDSLVQKVVEEFEGLFKTQGIALTTGDLTPALVIGDSHSLHTVLTNLVENALQYTESPGKVTISCVAQGGAVRLVVEDTGIGIAGEHRQHLFERFYRVDKSRSRSQGGSGLGLAIVKAIVELHNGSVSVASELGRGSKFSVVMPQAAPAVLTRSSQASI